jgi:hypothetical protein
MKEDDYVVIKRIKIVSRNGKRGFEQEAEDEAR